MIVVYLEKHVRTFRHLCKNVACYSFVVGDEASHLVWSHYMGCLFSLVFDSQFFFLTLGTKTVINETIPPSFVRTGGPFGVCRHRRGLAESRCQPAQSRGDAYDLRDGQSAAVAGRHLEVPLV